MGESGKDSRWNESGSGARKGVVSNRACCMSLAFW